MMEDKLFYGRDLLETEIPKKAIHRLNERTSFMKKGDRLFCARCSGEMTKVSQDACFCQQACAYCRHCLQMGKNRMCQPLYSLAERNQFSFTKHQKLLAWEGTLSMQQEEASAAIIESIQQKETRLLWAVAGAGKTEMLFKGIEYALQRNQRVCLASPRVDVCLELAPRLNQAFPTTPQVLLYGGMEEAYTYTPLVLATTHQLLRFKEAFDVLIIDEVDAFPFHSDQMLQFAAKKARKKEATVLYLSATPTKDMQKRVSKKQLKATILPARYHGHPLPVPQVKSCWNWRDHLLKEPLKTSFGKLFDQKVKEKRKMVVFTPNIRWMLAFEEKIKGLYPNVPFHSVYSEDPLRKEKVMDLREEKVQFLLSSTILERGVTFPNVDVFVIGAEDRIFTESALVQIAGRAGRSPLFPKGDVFFFHDGQSQAMKQAIRQIKDMNQLAKKRGLLT